MTRCPNSSLGWQPACLLRAVGPRRQLHAAQAAALAGMVARYSDGDKYADDAETIDAIVVGSDQLRMLAMTLAEKDATAFTQVATAFALPKGSEAEKAARSRAIADALLGACQPPAEIIETAEHLFTLAERLLPIGNRNVITDVAAAAEAARAAATTARVNIEVNLAGITDNHAERELRAHRCRGRRCRTGGQNHRRNSRRAQPMSASALPGEQLAASHSRTCCWPATPP